MHVTSCWCAGQQLLLLLLHWVLMSPWVEEPSQQLLGCSCAVQVLLHIGSPSCSVPASRQQQLCTQGDELGYAAASCAPVLFQAGPVLCCAALHPLLHPWLLVLLLLLTCRCRTSGP